MGANESAPVLFSWTGGRFGFSAVRISPRLLPWLAILGLCLLKPNRRIQAWLVWLPLGAVAGLGYGMSHWFDVPDEAFALFVRLLPTALAFGWAAVLLLSGSNFWRTRSAHFGVLLLAVGAFSMLATAVGEEWRQEFMTDIVCAVLLEFVVLALAAALNLAGRSTRPPLRVGRFLGWFALWSVLIWIVLALPPAILALLRNREELFGIAGTCGLGWLIVLGVSVPFLVLAAASRVHRERLGTVVMPPEASDHPEIAHLAESQLV